MEESNLKIVYCAPALYSAGGVERVVSVKASFFAEVYGYSVTIITTEGQGKPPFFALSPKVQTVNLGIGFEELWNVSFLRKVWLYVWKQRRYRRLLTAELMRLRPDVTISVLRREVNFLGKVKDGSLKLGELHVNRANYRNFEANETNALKRLFARYWMGSLVRKLRRLDCLVVLTEASLRAWPELERVVLIPDPLTLRTDAVSPLTAKRVVAIGRYAYQKGFDLLLQAWAVVGRQHPDWRLDVYGMGDRGPYEQLRAQLGIPAECCRLNGEVADVVQEYQNSSVFVLSSRFEGFGLVLIEAMSCGVPVVAFDCDSGPGEIVTDGVDGWLAPPSDVVLLAERMGRLMGDAGARQSMGRAARLSAQRYAIERIGAQWQSLFGQLMSARRGQKQTDKK